MKEFGLVLDWETSGVPDEKVPWRTYLEGPQGIEIGAILVRLPHFEQVAEFSSRVRFLGIANGISFGGPLYEGITWNSDAEKIHGIAVSDLRQERHPSSVATEFTGWVEANIGSGDPRKEPLMVCGHNPAFDLYYTRQLLFIGGAERRLKLIHRTVDTFSLGYFLFNCETSDELFKHVSGITRTVHSALDDARLTLQALQHMYQYCRNTNQVTEE